MTIRVKRGGMARIFKGATPFRAWLNEQPRAKLTFRKDIERKDEKGWTVEDFVRECWHRGLDVRIGTAFKWASGSTPRSFGDYALRKEFPGIRFS